MEKQLSRGEKAARDEAEQLYNFTPDKYDSILRRVDEKWTRLIKLKKLCYFIGILPQALIGFQTNRDLEKEQERYNKRIFRLRKIARLLCRYLSLLIFGTELIAIAYVAETWSSDPWSTLFPVIIYHIFIFGLINFMASFANNKLFWVLSRKRKELIITLGIFVATTSTLLWFIYPWLILVPIVINIFLIIEMGFVLLIVNIGKMFDNSSRYPWDERISRYMERKEAEEIKASNSMAGEGIGE